jgi:hypothetical protein
MSGEFPEARIQTNDIFVAGFIFGEVFSLRISLGSLFLRLLDLLQVTVEWDPVSDTGAISYEICVSPYPVSNPLGPGVHTLVLETSATEAVVTFPSEGKYAVGVRTKKLIAGEEPFSKINWSCENGEMTPNPFIVGYYTGPAAPVKLRLR